MRRPLLTLCILPLTLGLILSTARSAVAAWPTSPVVNVPLCLAAGNQTIRDIVPDGAGGSIVTWEDQRGGNYDIYAQHVLATGTVDPAWPVNGLALCTAVGDQTFPRSVSDGAGGVIVTWMDARFGLDHHIYAQRALASGVVDPNWPSNGQAICLAAEVSGGQTLPRIATDGAGGAIITWNDYGRGESGGSAAVYAQRVLASGLVAPGWTPDGVAITTDEPINGNPSLVSDGASGAIIAYLHGANHEVRARRLLSNGVLDPTWPSDGSLLCAASGLRGSIELESDDASGAIVVWQDQRGGVNTDDVYAQRVLSSGALAGGWPADGRALCTAAGVQRDASIERDGTGGAVVVWQDDRSGPQVDIYGQRVLANGSVDPAWPVNGLPICTAVGNQSDPEVVLTPGNRVTAAWVDSRDAGNPNNIFAQSVDLSGTITPAWPVDGVAVCLATAQQFRPLLVADELGGAIIGWLDRRSGSQSDIYAQRVRADGLLGSNPALVSVPPVVISSLTHEFTPPSPPFSPNYTVGDHITIPGSGYSSSGFTASLATGDTVRVRFEAPPGKKFVVNHTPSMLSETFFFNTFWSAATDADSHIDPHTVVFENLTGAPPSQIYSLVGVADGGRAILCQKQYTVAAPFSFTAIEIRILPSQPLTLGPQTFGPVESNSAPSWGVSAELASGTDVPVMSIEDVGVTDVPIELAPGTGFALALLSRNPTSGPIQAEFSLEREAEVRLSVHDIQGREVALLRSGRHAPGRHRAQWDGATERGAAPVGVYHLRYAAGGKTFTRRVVVTR